MIHKELNTSENVFQYVYVTSVELHHATFLLRTLCFCHLFLAALKVKKLHILAATLSLLIIVNSNRSGMNYDTKDTYYTFVRL